MFINKLKQNKISFRTFKDTKYLYKENFLKNKLFEQKFSIFFYYNHFSKENYISFKKFLITESLQYHKIKKNILKNFLQKKNFNTFNNIILNNTLIINHNQNLNFDYKIINKLLKLKDLFFLGIYIEKKFLRLSEFTKLQQLNTNKKIQNIKQIQIQKILLQKIKQNICFKKCLIN